LTTRTNTKLLTDLGLASSDTGGLRVSGISVDSRETREGHLFAALPGVNSHGADFAAQAVERGAIAILTDRTGAAMLREMSDITGILIVTAEDPREALAFAAALWSEAQPEIVVAVTGTNGKTSVATFARQLWAAMGAEAVNLGTTGVEGAVSMPLSHTTPEPITLHRTLAAIADAGVTHAAMEASSHGLRQRRLDGVRLAAAGFTNITQDHLDYHPNFEDYFHAKAELFDRVMSEDGTAVINIDDPRGEDMANIAEARGQDVLTVGHSSFAALRITNQRFDATGQDLRFDWGGAPHMARLELLGGFQADNALLAAGLCIATGSDPAEVFAALKSLTTVRGRMEFAAKRSNGAAIFVDYAHTPDAIQTALRAMRPHVLGRVHVVFGAGGDRDRCKRPLMGEAASHFADVITITDDNPRGEDPGLIRRAILSGTEDGTAEVFEVGDRAEAILRGIDMLQPGDALLIAGKGHETGQIVGDDVLPFDDAEQASVAVAALDGRMA